MIIGQDQTEILSRGYWPSYNIAFYPEIYNISGFPILDKKLNKTIGSSY